MLFKRKIITSLIIGSGVLGFSGLASANDSGELESLRTLVQQLDQKVKILERKTELADEAAETKKKETPIVKASEKGFGLQSADGKNEIKLRGLLQADYRYYDEGASDVRARSNNRAGSLDPDGFHDAADTALLRRVRPTIEGTLFGKYDFRFTPEFGGGSASVVDAYIDARFDPAFKVRAGKFKSFVGLERMQSGGDIKFLERSYVTNTILPNRDLGVAVHGDLLDNRLNYAIGIVNGVADGGNISSGTEFNEDKELTFRLFATPFNQSVSALGGLGFGIGGTYTDFQGERNLDFTDTSVADATRNGLPSYVTNGQQTFFRYGGTTVADGKRYRVSPQANYYYGPFGVIAEYAVVSQDVSLLNSATSNAATAIVAGSRKNLNHDAWQIAASYLLTGEDASFKGVKPKQDFDLEKGGWGAWELVARYSEINLDGDTFKNKAGDYAAEKLTTTAGAYSDLSKSAKSAHSWTAGVNWYLNSNAKIALNYEHTSFDGGAIVAGQSTIDASGSRARDREDERALLARFQVAF